MQLEKKNLSHVNLLQNRRDSLFSIRIEVWINSSQFKVFWIESNNIFTQTLYILDLKIFCLHDNQFLSYTSNVINEPKNRIAKQCKLFFNKFSLGFISSFMFSLHTFSRDSIQFVFMNI